MIVVVMARQVISGWVSGRRSAIRANAKQASMYRVAASPPPCRTTANHRTVGGDDPECRSQMNRPKQQQQVKTAVAICCGKHLVCQEGGDGDKNLDVRIPAVEIHWRSKRKHSFQVDLFSFLDLPFATGVLR